MSQPTTPRSFVFDSQPVVPWSRRFSRFAGIFIAFLFLSKGLLAQADLQVTKTVNNPNPAPGATIVYTIKVRNNGPVAANNVRIYDTLPAGVSFVSASANEGSYVIGLNLWGNANNLDLNVNEERTLTITCTVNAGTLDSVIRNTAGVNFSPQPDPNPANDQATATLVVGSADISLIKTAPASMYDIGDTIDYALTVINNGPHKAAVFSMKDILPANLTFVSASTSFGFFNADSMTWYAGNDFLPATAGQNTASLTLRAKVKAGTGGLFINNLAHLKPLQAGNLAANDSSAFQIQVHGADLALTQTVSNAAPTDLDDFFYTLTVTNNGPDTAFGVSVGDTLPNGIRYLSNVPSQGTYVNGVWSGITLAPGASATLIINVRLEYPCTSTNEAYILTSSQPDGNQANNMTSLLVAGYKSFAAGAAIINMGVTPQTVNNGLRPYGLIYQLVRTLKIPVYWVINPNKSFVNPLSKTDQIDMTIAGITYRSGFFVIPAEFVPFAQSTINAWVNAYPGLTVNFNRPAFTAPVFNFISSFPNAVLDQQNGDKIRDAFYLTAGIPDSSYRLGNPGNLTACDDIYAMPHADPQDWSPASGWGATLKNFVLDKGYLWAACHAVSALESLVDLNSDGQPDCNFLSNAGLVTWDNHGDGTPPYSYNGGQGMFASTFASDPYMQFIGIMDGALQNGSEQIFLPYAQGWRAGTRIAIYDQDQPDLGIFPPGPAAALAYGYAFDNRNYGKVMYQASHTIAGGTVPQNVASARAFGNFLLEAGITSRPEFSFFSASNDHVKSGESITFNILITGGTQPYTVNWSSPCGGTFPGQNNNATQTQTFIAPVVTDTSNCLVTVEVTDACGRKNAYTVVVNVVPQNDLSVEKSVSNPAPLVGSNVTFTLTASNAGPSNGTLVQVTDTLPAGYSYISHSTVFGTFNPATGIWSIGNLNTNNTASLEIVARVNAEGNYLNQATISGKQFDYNLSNNTDTALTVPVAQADLSVVKTVNNATPYMGGQVTFTMVASNAGPSRAVNATLSDLLPSGYTYVSNIASAGSYNAVTGVWTIGDMDSNTTQTLTLTAQVLGSGNYNNVATITSNTTDPNPNNNTDSASTTPVPGADLSVIKSASNNAPFVGTEISFNILLSNVGNANTGVVLNDVLPSGYTYISHTASHGTFTPGTGEWAVGNMADGSTYTLTLNVFVNGSGNWVNQATATGNALDPNPSNNTDTAATTPFILAQPDINQTLMNTPVSGTVATNDEVLPGSTFSLIGTMANGTLVFNTDGSYTYTPNPGFVGTDVVSYSVCLPAPSTLCDTTTLTIEVTPIFTNEQNDVIAQNDYGTTPFNTPITLCILCNDSDPNGNSIGTPTLLSNPASGTVTLNPNGTVTYTPAPGFTGQVSFTYSICDDGSPVVCDTATVVVDVLPTNAGVNQTYANDDAYSTLINTPVSGSVALNDTDPQGDPVSFTLVSNVSNGTLTLNADGTFSYTPAPGYVGPDRFVYSKCDNGTPVACDTATAYITVNAPVQDANPDINQTTVNVPVSGSVATNDNVIPGSQFTVLGSMSNGTLVLNPNGTYTYTPNANFIGRDSVQYIVCSPAPVNLCDTTTLTIIVTPGFKFGTNTVIATDDHSTTPFNTPVLICLLCNDMDPQDDSIGNPVLLSNPSFGTVVMNPDGSVTYTPDPGFIGSDLFSYVICDNGSPVACDTANVYVDVTNIPVTVNQTYANDDAYITDKNVAVGGDVSRNDTDPQNDDVTFTQVTQPVNGTVVFNANGTFTYTPAAGYVGPDQFIYSKCDNGTPVACDTATVYLTIIETNIPLPAQLGQFGAFAEGCAVKVEWTTLQESNVAWYDVQRRVNGGAFEKVGRVQAAGNSQELHSYRFSDVTAPKGDLEYRLLVIDADGRSAFSPVAALSMNCSAAESIRLYPNPASDLAHLQITVPDSRTISIQMTDAMGRTVFTTALDLDNETRTIDLPLSHLAAGAYSVRVSDGSSNVQVLRLIKSKP